MIRLVLFAAFVLVPGMAGAQGLEHVPVERVTGHGDRVADVAPDLAVEADPWPGSGIEPVAPLLPRAGRLLAPDEPRAEPDAAPSQAEPAPADDADEPRDAGSRGLVPPTDVLADALPLLDELVSGLPALDLAPAAPDAKRGPAPRPAESSAPPADAVRVAAVAASAAPVSATVLAVGAALQAAPLAAWSRPRLWRVAPLLGLYARIPRDELLDHPLRSRIYDALKATPGLTIEQLAFGTAISRSAVRHHVRALEAAGLVSFEHLGRERIHYASGARARAMNERLTADPLRSGLMARLARGPATLSELSRAIGSSPSKTHFHLRRLREAGLVQRDASGYRAAGATDA